MADNASLRVLIADDTATDRMILESIIRRSGHTPLTAVDGMDAIEVFQQTIPDIVLMDALMPRMDGWEAAREIKRLAGERFVPIIFLTSQTDTESLVKCLDAGGDDFLSKPYNQVILNAKINSFNRMREMHATILSQRDQIALHNEHLVQEQKVAKEVFDNIALTGSLDAKNLRSFMSPLAVFNGDILVSALHPSGNMLVMLGDFTGHGLPAAIGAMPLTSIFYGMIRKGFAMNEVLREVNRKLTDILPSGIFCCATMVEVNFDRQQIKVWNGGLPYGFICRQDSGDVERMLSRHLPLGILPDKDFKDDCVYFDLAEGDRFFLLSDGIIEARNAEGDMFGEERLQQCFSDYSPTAEIPLFDTILARVKSFIGEEQHADDLSLVEVTMLDHLGILSDAEMQAEKAKNGLMEWSLEFEVKPSTFKIFDPLPLLLGVLVEVPGLKKYSGQLYTILSELYSNSLDHGLLGLDSELKNSAQGFVEYYQIRQQRLEQLQEGFICFRLKHQMSSSGGRLIIYLKDSGGGFDLRQLDRSSLDHEAYSGRGIPLLKELCHSVSYLGAGNEVEAVFSWQFEN